MADAVRYDLDKHLARLRALQFKLHDRQRCLRLERYGGSRLHTYLPGCRAEFCWVYSGFMPAMQYTSA
jgi:hypothetical protein